MVISISTYIKMYIYTKIRLKVVGSRERVSFMGVEERGSGKR